MIYQIGISNLAKDGKVDLVEQHQVVEVVFYSEQHSQRQPFALKGEVDVGTVAVITLDPCKMASWI